jgi:hypothetical protein
MTVERRNGVRSPAAAGSRGRLRSTVEVEILDISPGGLRLELAASLRPGAVYDLLADLPGHHLAAQVRVTRCAAGGFRDDGKGGRFLLYRAGAEFLWSLDEPRVALERFLQESGKRPAGSSDPGILRLSS